MSSTVTPNMGLTVPGVGTEQGPDFGLEINQDLNIIDSHDHTPGNGIQLTPASLNINSNLALNNNSLTSVKSMVLSAQSSVSDMDSVYVNGVDLYFKDGNGNNVRLTQSGAVAGTPGSISGLTSPASATWVSADSTFVWQANSGVAANMDAASLIVRYPGSYPSPSGNYISIQAPSSLSSGYSLTLPALPSATSLMSISTSGVIAATTLQSPYVDNSTIEVNSNVLRVKPAGITTTQISGTAGITGGQIASATITGSNLANNINLPGSDVTANSSPLVVGNSSVSGLITHLFGTVDSSGSIVVGTGFTVNHSATGDFIINFSTSFASEPSVVATSWDNQKTIAVFSCSSSSIHFTTRLGTSGSSSSDVKFSFMVNGLK